MADDTKQPEEVLPKLQETIVLGFELLGSEVTNLPDQLSNALQAKDVQAAINQALIAFAANRVASTPSTVSEDDAKALAKLLADTAGKPLAKEVIEQIKKSAHYKALDQAAKELSAAFAQSPMGAWLDKNKKWLYIVGAGAVVGGVVAMYVTRSGDLLTKPLALVPSDPVPFKQIGSLTLSAGVDEIKFTPSERLIEVKPFVSADWGRVKAKLDVSVLRSDKTATTVSVDGSVLVPITPGVKATAKGTATTANKDWSLSLGVKIDVTKSIQLDIFGGVGKGPLGKPAPSIPMPDPPGAAQDNRTHGFVGLGISGTF